VNLISNESSRMVIIARKPFEAGIIILIIWYMKEENHHGEKNA
jgi:hypothetical protein